MCHYTYPRCLTVYAVVAICKGRAGGRSAYTVVDMCMCMSSSNVIIIRTTISRLGAHPEGRRIRQREEPEQCVRKTPRQGRWPTHGGAELPCRELDALA